MTAFRTRQQRREDYTIQAALNRDAGAALRRGDTAVAVDLIARADTIEPAIALVLAARAVEARCPDAIAALAKAGASFDGAVPGRPETPLHKAIDEGHPCCVRALLDGGADPDGATGLLWDAGAPILWAMNAKHLPDTRALMLRILAEAGADLDAAPNPGSASPIRTTPLRAAIMRLDACDTELLLRLGADPDAAHGETPLDTLLASMRRAETGAKTAEWRMILESLCRYGAALDAEILRPHVSAHELLDLMRLSEAARASRPKAKR